MIRNMMPSPMQRMMDLIQQYQQIKQNPNQLATLLKQRGMIDENQFVAINKMGGNYEQIGQYLMQNGKMPANVQQYENQVNQVQNIMSNNIKEHQ